LCSHYKSIVFTVSVDIMDLVECYHLELLSQKIVRWEGIAYHLGLVEADVEAIKHDSDYDSQKLYMLQRWKRKEHANATYKVLHSCFVKHENGNLAEDLLKIMKEKVQPTSIIQRHQEKLKKHYKNFYILKLIIGLKVHLRQFTSI